MDWLTLRNMTPEDLGEDGGLVFLWLKSYALSKYGRAIGASIPGSQAELSYWAAERPRVMAHLANDGVRVLCDAGKPTTVYAFACFTPSTPGSPHATYHAVVVKRELVKSGELGLEALGMLLGEDVDAPCGYTTDLPDLERIFQNVEMKNHKGHRIRVPTGWYFDGSYYVRAMLQQQEAA